MSNTNTKGTGENASTGLSEAPVAKDSVGAIIGRWQFLHYGHCHLIEEAYKRCDQLIIMVGSSQEERTIKNPLSIEERVHCINMFLIDKGMEDAVIVPIPDMLYQDDAWAEMVDDKLDKAIPVYCQGKIPLYCFDRGGDHKERDCLYPYFELTCLGKESYDVSSTDIRKKYFEYIGSWEEDVYDATVTYIKKLDLLDLDVEYNHLISYDWGWWAAKDAAPFPLPAFDCVDVIVYDTYQDKVLTIIRKNAPGVGKRALPGGFVDKGETWAKAAARELEEETGMTCDESSLRFVTGLSAGERGGDRNTFVFSVDIRNCEGTLKAQEEEVTSVEWVSIPEVSDKGWFSDHLHIINKWVEGGF